MLLIMKVGVEEAKYVNDIKECLIHNMSNSIITKIVIFSNTKDLDKKINVDSKSRKVSLMKTDMDLFDILRYGKRNAKKYIIYSTPFVKFGTDLSNAFKNLDEKKSVVKDDGSFYVYHKSLNILKERNIDDILDGRTIISNLTTQKMGYHNMDDFLFMSKSIRISNIPKDDVLPIVGKTSIEEVLKDVLKEAEPKEVSKAELGEKVVDLKPNHVYSKIEGQRKIDVVIVSVDYNDYLIICLENNIKFFDNITVVTSSSDFMCHKICKKFGVNMVITDRMYEDGAAFNKGKAINEGISSISDPDFILLLDADILVVDEIDVDSLEDGVLYSADRYIMPDYESYLSYFSGKIEKYDLDVDRCQGLGFFQLFRYSPSISYSECYPDASESDMVFKNIFEKITNINKEVFHLGKDSTNWKGRRTETFLSHEQIDLLLREKDRKNWSFKICSFYYNPDKDREREENLLRFLEQFEGYEDNFMIGVVDYNGDFKIPEELRENIILFKGDENNHIWYKEIILNKMIDMIDTDYVIWMDCDLIYEDMNWLEDIATTVGNNDFVQLFSNINYLDKDGNVSCSYKSIASSKSDKIDYLLGEGYKPGGSWIGKTSILKDKKLFEKMYVGGGDTIFLYGLFGIKDGYTLGLVKEANEKIWKSAVDWIDSLDSYRIGYLNASIDHLYHGELSDRNYNGRYERLRKYEVDELDSFYGKKIVMYTCISGNYDKLKEVVRSDRNIDYICFTDQDIKSETWEIRPIPEYLNFFESTKRARCIKILPHLFLDKYDISIWVDGNIQVLGETNRFLLENMNGNFCIPKHPDRICVYEEADAVKRMKKDSVEMVDGQVSRYRELGYPEDFGMVQSNIIIRQHKEIDCVDICESWWEEVSKNSRRDQLAFNFCLWKRDLSISIMDPSIICSDFFQIWTHAGKMVKVRKGYGSLKNYINGIEV